VFYQVQQNLESARRDALRRAVFQNLKVPALDFDVIEFVNYCTVFVVHIGNSLSGFKVTKKSQPSQNLIITAFLIVDKLDTYGTAPNLQRVCEDSQAFPANQKDFNRRKR
jgi:hypothetical protein